MVPCAASHSVPLIRSATKIPGRGETWCKDPTRFLTYAMEFNCDRPRHFLSSHDNIMHDYFFSNKFDGKTFYFVFEMIFLSLRRYLKALGVSYIHTILCLSDIYKDLYLMSRNKLDFLPPFLPYNSYNLLQHDRRNLSISPIQNMCGWTANHDPWSKREPQDRSSQIANEFCLEQLEDLFDHSSCWPCAYDIGAWFINLLINKLHSSQQPQTTSNLIQTHSKWQTRTPPPTREEWPQQSKAPFLSWISSKFPTLYLYYQQLPKSSLQHIWHIAASPSYQHETSPSW